MSDVSAVAPQDRDPVYLDPDDGLWTYRASGLYACQNILAMYRLGYGDGGHEAPVWLQKRYNAGHYHEGMILANLRDKFFIHTFGEQMSMTMRVGADAKIMGHVDALGSSNLSDLTIGITHRNGRQVGTEEDPFLLTLEEWMFPFVIDGKALSDGSTKAWLSGGFNSFPYYAWQQSMYQHCTGGVRPAPVVMAVKNKNSDEHYVDFYDEPVIGRATLMKRVLQIEKMAEEGETTLFRDECNPVTFPCPFWDMHPRKPDPSTIPEADLVALARRRAAANARIESAEREVKDLNLQLIEALGGEVTNKKVRDDEISSLSLYHHNSRVLDKEALTRDYPLLNIDDYYTTRESPNLSVKVNAKRKTKQAPEEETQGQLPVGD